MTIASGLTRRAFLGALLAAAAPSVWSCSSDDGELDSGRSTAAPSTSRSIALPPPAETGIPLAEVLRRRRSVREYAPDPLTDAEIGQLLWAAQGVTADWGGRTAPSAGARYPLELYAATEEGVAHYLPDGHRAEPVGARDLRGELRAAAGGQDPVGQAPLVIAVVAVPARTEAQYGARARRYVDLEAGHAAQGLLLQAVALDLVAVPIGAFDDDAVASTLDLPADQEPRYLIPVGRART